MAKNDFDMDFDFEKEYGFDPREFLDSDGDADIDFSEFGEEAAESDAGAAETDEFDDFDLDDLDLDGIDLPDDLNFGEEPAKAEDFLNTDFEEPAYEEEDFSAEDFDVEEFGTEDYAEEDYSDDAFEDDDDGSEMIITGRGPHADYAEQGNAYAAADLDEDNFENAVYGTPEPQAPAYDADVHSTEPVYAQPVEEDPEDDMDDLDPVEMEEQNQPEKKKPARRPRKEKAPKPEKAPRVKKEKTGPNIFEKIFQFYMAPLREVEAPQDPNNPRRRKKRSKMRIIKEVYLPPIIVGVTLILVLSFVAGAVSNAIEQKKLDNEAAMRESQSAAEEADRQAKEAQQVLDEAHELALGYDYDAAIKKLESYTGEPTQDMIAKKAEYVNTQNKMVEWKDYSSIPNLSFHVLIADPARAFADKDLGGQYNKNFVTIDEFSKILDQLYKGGYVLVDFDSFTETNTGLDGNANFFTKPIALPDGKKPVMITETMVNYYNYMVDSNKDGEPDAGGAGFAYRLIVDNNGDIKAQMVDANGQTQTGNYDLVPILEDFIKEHPDFSYQGARATLAVSGSEGVFGYRTNTSYISSVSQGYYDEQVAGAKEVVQALRDKGYTIACYTYDNVAYGQLSANQIKADMQDWTNQITPILGEVEVLVYARTSDIGDYSGAKFSVLSSSGFRYFVKHGSTPSAEVNNTYVKQARLMVTGENMVWNNNQFSGLFDCAAILNNQRGNVPKS